jgi:formate dehydrogenase major subunit
VQLTLDGHPVTARAGETILQLADRLGVAIPRLCATDGLRPDGNCRACVVEIEGERTLAASCCRTVADGMAVHAHSLRARRSQDMVLELLLADMPEVGHGQHRAAVAPALQAGHAGPLAEAEFSSSVPESVAAPQMAPLVALAADQPHGELSQWANHFGIRVRPALAALRREAVAPDLSHPAMAVNLDACIQCTRCVRACREEQVNDVIGMAHRGAHTQVVFDLVDPMGASSCVACGECVQACPTGALSVKLPAVLPVRAAPARQQPSAGTVPGDKTREDAGQGAPAAPALRPVDSVCPFCGVGCQLTYQVQDGVPAAAATPPAAVTTTTVATATATAEAAIPTARIIRVDGRNGPANAGRLCVKGRFGFDYIHHPDRLTTPLIRKAGVAKDPAHLLNPPHWSEVFRPATWSEALDLAAGGFKRLREQHGPHALVGFGSAKGSNEEAYLFQKLVRVGFGSHNVDHCTRLCHASSVAALLEGVGSGAVSNPVADVEQAELIFIIGSNPTANHPVAATWMKNAAQRGARIVLADPRRTDIARHAWRTLQFRADTDVVLLNAMLYTVFEEGLVNHAYVAEHVDNAEAVRQAVQAFRPEDVAAVCGIAAPTIREVARAYATSRAAITLWGMGVSQHIHGTDNVRALIALATLTGQMGRPGTGLHPLRGQNNVQGASDAGLIPMMFPNYQRVTDTGVREWFEGFWGTPLSAESGLTVVEVMHQALADEADPRKVRGLYVMGENPAMSDPDLNHARHALSSLDHLVVQDLFLTETAWLADVVLPASAWPEKWGTVSNTDRTVQLGRQALPPPGDARADLWIIQQLAQRLGRADGQPMGWNYGDPDNTATVYFGVEQVYEEMRQAMHASIGGITWARLLRDGAVTYPCLSEDDPGQAVVFTQGFPTANGRAQLVPTAYIAADEVPDADYPLVLITGRQLEHWHTGSMTRRAGVLDALEPGPTVSMNATELTRLGLVAGQSVRLASRRGSVTLTARQDNGTPDGTVFIPFAYAEAAANLLTNAALDPFGKIPEFKFCAVRVERNEN